MKLATQILILVFMILSNGRVFSIKRSKFDSLVMLAPLAFLLALLNLFAYGIDFLSSIIFILSILVLLSNFHALIRFTNHLYVDHYSPLMKIWAVGFFFLCLVLCIYFKPVEISSEELGVTETKINYTGSFAAGFLEAESFSICSAYLTEFSLEPDLSERENAVIFMPDKRGDTECYAPFLKYLSQKGHTVCACDFFARDIKWLHTFDDSKIMRRTGMIIRSLLNEKYFYSQREFYTYNFSKEFEAIIKMLDSRYGSQCKYFIVVDSLALTAASDIQKKYGEKISGIFDISSVDEFMTSGYGFVEQTSPTVAALLKRHRDASCVAPKIVAEKTDEKIKENFEVLNNAEES